MRKLSIGAALIAALFFIPQSRAADNPIFPTGPVFRLTGLVWGTSNPGGFNQNFFFTPLSQNESVCVYVKNNNTSNNHSFAGAVTVTSDPSDITPSDGTWQTATSLTSLTAAISPGLPAGFGLNISGVAQVSINLSASTVQAGGPETANVTIIQTQGSCFAGQNFFSGSPQTISATAPLQTISEGMGQSYLATATTVNPAIAATLLHVIDLPTSTRTVYLKTVTISTTAAGNIRLVSTTAQGTTCTAFTPLSLKLNVSTPVAQATAQFGCATGPTGQVILFDLFLNANTVTQIDLGGFIEINSNVGLAAISPAAITGSVSVNLDWYEK